MFQRSRLLAVLGLCGLAASAAFAQPQFVNLPQPADISDDGTVVVGSAGGGTYRWVRGPGGSTSLSVIPLSTGGSGVKCSTDGARVLSQMANNDINLGVEGFAIAGLWTSASGIMVPQHDPNVFAGTGTPNTINVPRGFSRDGRFITGFAYANAGIGGYRPMIIDTLTNTVRNPGGIANPAARIICVNDDGTVIAGDDDVTGSAQRPAIWRFNAETNAWVGQIVDPGAGGASSGSINCLSADGTKAAGQATFNNNRLYRYELNTETGQYAKVELASALTPPGAALTRVNALAMSPDGNTIYGQYNQSRAFIWTAAGGMQDLTNILVAEGITGLPTPTTVLASVQEVSSDGNTLVVIGGLGGASGIVYRNSVGCVQPAETPTTSTPVISKCATTAIFNAGANGTGPFTYAWRRSDGTPIVDGPTGRGASTFSGATTSQMRVNNATPLDADTYECTVSNACGSFVVSRTVTAQAADPYDTCAEALEASGTGTLNFNMCGAYIDESPASCATTQRADVWVRYTALQAGDYRITGCGGSNFDTILSLYNSCGGAETVCNNNFCGSIASIERITLTEGQVVYVRLGVGSSVPGSPVTLAFEQLPPPPANDTCGGATLITANGSYPWDNTFAGNDGAASCQVNSGKDVWFVFWPARRGTVTADTCGTTLNTVLSAYDSCGGTQVACNDNRNITGCTFQSIVTDVPVAAGRPVYLRIAANTVSGIGAGNLNVTFTPVGCPADFNGDGALDPDDLSDAIACYFASPACPGMDFDGTNNIDPDDLADYIAAYFGGGC